MTAARRGGPDRLRVRGAGALLAAALLVVPTGTARVAAQERGTAPPEEVADEFHRAFESMAWRAGAQRIHPDALALFRYAVTVLVESEARTGMLDRLLGGVDADGYAALDDAEVFRRVMGALLRETPGLMHALSTRRHEVVGAVREGADSAHVVYRSFPTLQGASPEVKVMTLARVGGPEGPWRVRRADELDSVLAALRGLPVPPPPPAPADTTRAEPGPSGPTASSAAPRRPATPSGRLRRPAPGPEDPGGPPR